ncbi:hypothetical protein TNCV_1452331 [Trichonephila clavipes]|nr:hypothetical protein TNCV_1452331 [Trichonephila clavipes]
MAILFQPTREVKREGKMQIRKLLNNRSLDFVVGRTTVAPLYAAISRKAAIIVAVQIVHAVRDVCRYTVLPDTCRTGNKPTSWF